MEPILSTQNLAYLDMLHYPDLAVQTGQTVFVTGESGSGKTTLFRLLNGTLSPSAGRVLYAGQNIAELDPVALRQEVVLVSQGVYLFDGTIADNFRGFYRYRALPAPGEDQMRRLLHTCAIDLPLNADTATMSGGERQRTYIAIYLSFAPRVLLLDEPTSALDALRAEQMLEGVRGHCAQNGMTLLAISHDSAIARRFADQIVHIEGGRG